eukprot:395229_1
MSNKQSHQPPSVELQCFIHNGNKNCDYVNRLLQALKYYQSSDVVNNSNHSEDLVKFCQIEYPYLLNDYIHLVTQHIDDLENITHQIKKTNSIRPCGTDCVMLQRHYNRRRVGYKKKINIANTIDSIANFYTETFDSMHMYLIHLYDLGWRQQNNSIALQNQDESKKNAHFNLCLDTKFKININDNQSDVTIQISEIIEHLKMNRIAQQEIGKILKFIVVEEYDSDAVAEDFEYEHKSNISHYTDAKHGCKVMQQYIKMKHVSSSSQFNIGLIFYYWPWYEQEKKEVDAIDQDNINIYGGHSIKSLCVPQKYETFKDEIFSYLTIQEYTGIMTKANQYISTYLVKQTKAADEESDLHYGIAEGTSLSVQNLKSLILYCDFSDLSKDFSSTFRSLTISETLESIKYRNRNYWWWSKILRETVEYFGNNKYGRWQGNQLIRETGPYYCGMSQLLLIPQFNLRLCCPTSTSKHKEAAQNFCGDGAGVMIQLNNKGDIYGSCLRCFNCSWISKYKEEDERLFNGGQYKVRIESLIIMKNQYNYETFFHALFWFDCMLSGSDMKDCDDHVSAVDENIISSLIEDQLGMKRNSDIHEYIYDTFCLFCVQKTLITINIHYIKLYFIKMYHLLQINMFRNLIFNIFPNINKVIIYSTNEDGKHIYPQSLPDISSMIHSITGISSNIEVIVKATHTYKGDNILAEWKGRSWIFDAWKSMKFKPKLEITRNSYGKEDCVTFTKTKTQNNSWFVDKDFILSLENYVTVDHCQEVKSDHDHDEYVMEAMTPIGTRYGNDYVQIPVGTNTNDGNIDSDSSSDSNVINNITTRNKSVTDYNKLIQQQNKQSSNKVATTYCILPLLLFLLVLLLLSPIFYFILLTLETKWKIMFTIVSIIVGLICLCVFIYMCIRTKHQKIQQDLSFKTLTEHEFNGTSVMHYIDMNPTNLFPPPGENIEARSAEGKIKDQREEFEDELSSTYNDDAESVHNHLLENTGENMETRGNDCEQKDQGEEFGDELSSTNDHLLNFTVSTGLLLENIDENMETRGNDCEQKDQGEEFGDELSSTNDHLLNFTVSTGLLLENIDENMETRGNDCEQKDQNEEFVDELKDKYDGNNLYHEKQKWEMCLLHALNSLLQKEEFTHKSL